MRKIVLFPFIIAVLSPIFTEAQIIENIQVKFENGLIAVHYDLMGGEPNELYEFYLYGSHDNYTVPLIEVSGDIGSGVVVGRDKIIYWDARKEFGNFKGDVNLRVIGGKYVPLVEFQNFESQLKVKRGKSYNLQWLNNTDSEKIYFELLRDGQPYLNRVLIPNTGNYNWFIANKMKVGRYRIRLSDVENPLKGEISGEFEVKRKIPLGVKFIPIVIAGGATYMLVSNGDSEPNEETIGDPPTTPPF